MSKFPLEHLVLKHLYSTFFLRGKRPWFATIQDSRQDYWSWSLVFWITNWIIKVFKLNETNVSRMYSALNFIVGLIYICYCFLIHKFWNIFKLRVNYFSRHCFLCSSLLSQLFYCCNREMFLKYCLATSFSQVFCLYTAEWCSRVVCIWWDIM